MLFAIFWTLNIRISNAKVVLKTFRSPINNLLLVDNILELEGGSFFNCANGSIKHTGDPNFSRHMQENVWYSPNEYYQSILEEFPTISLEIAKTKYESMKNAYQKYCN